MGRSAKNAERKISGEERSALESAQEAILAPSPSLLFSLAVFATVPHQTERLEEARFSFFHILNHYNIFGPLDFLRVWN